MPHLCPDFFNNSKIIVYIRAGDFVPLGPKHDKDRPE